MNARVVILTLALGWISACTMTTQPAMPTARLLGTVALVDSVRAEALDASGCLIEIIGTNRSTTSDRSGKWELADLTAGTYDIAVSHEGYGTTEIKDVTLAEGGYAYCFPRLHLKPTYYLALDTPQLVGGMLLLQIKDPGMFTSRFQPHIFVDRDTTAAAEHLLEIEGNSAYVKRAPLFESGDTVYLSTALVATYSGHFDAWTGKFRYTAYGPRSPHIRHIWK